LSYAHHIVINPKSQAPNPKQIQNPNDQNCFYFIYTSINNSS